MGARATRSARSTSAPRGSRAPLRQVQHADRPRFVAGSIGPDGHAAVEQRSRRSATSPSRSSRENYYDQAKYLVEGGVDVLLIETAQDILEVKAAIAGFERLFAEIGRRVPMQAQVTLDSQRPHAARHRHRQRA